MLSVLQRGQIRFVAEVRLAWPCPFSGHGLRLNGWRLWFASSWPELATIGAVQFGSKHQFNVTPRTPLSCSDQWKSVIPHHYCWGMSLVEEAPFEGPFEGSLGPVCGPDPFGVLAAAVAGVRNHVDGLRSAGLGGSGLGDAVVALVGLRSQVESVELVALEGYRQSMDWSVDGYRSVGSWLGARCGLPRGAVGRRVGE